MGGLNDELMRAMVYEGVSGVLQPIVSAHCR